MGFPQFTLLSGTINGVNLVFTTPTPYTAGTLSVYRNGQLLLNPGGNPWTETDPSTGVVTIHAESLPLTGDVMAAFYIDTTTDPLQTELTPIAGTLTEESPVSGQLAATEAVNGSVVQSEPLCGTLSDTEGIGGSVVEDEPVSGNIEVC